VTCYVTLGEYFSLAEQVTGVEAGTLARASRSDVADSALHAPQAGFGDVDYYADVCGKAAVLVCRLAWNHPLPDGNKGAAWAALVMFIDLNNAHGSPVNQTSIRPKKPCWRSLPERSTRPGPQRGSKNGFGSSTEAERGPDGPTPGAPKMAPQHQTVEESLSCDNPRRAGASRAHPEVTRRNH